MFQAMEQLQLAEHVESIRKDLAKVCVSCVSRHYTPHCGIVVMTAKSMGRVCCVTMADSAGHRERHLLTQVLRGDLGCRMAETELIFWDVVNRPHPRMATSRRFVQCELFRRFQKCL